jgi:hypothetical protein
VTSLRRSRERLRASNMGLAKGMRCASPYLPSHHQKTPGILPNQLRVNPRNCKLSACSSLA